MRRGSVDVLLTHDWPVSITRFGDTQKLLREKSFFGEDIAANKLGSPGTDYLMHLVQPSYFFSAHLHCKYTAVVDHQKQVAPAAEGSEEVPDQRKTKFLALDKVQPRRHFLQILDFDAPRPDDKVLRFSPQWLSILQQTDHLSNFENHPTQIPVPNFQRLTQSIGSAASFSDQQINGVQPFTPNPDQLETLEAALKVSLGDDPTLIPTEFIPTVIPYNPSNHGWESAISSDVSLNPQSLRLAQALNLKLVPITVQRKAAAAPVVVSNPEEIDILDDEQESEASVSQSTESQATDSVAPSSTSVEMEPSVAKSNTEEINLDDE